MKENLVCGKPFGFVVGSLGRKYKYLLYEYLNSVNSTSTGILKNRHGPNFRVMARMAILSQSELRTILTIKVLVNSHDTLHVIGDSTVLLS